MQTQRAGGSANKLDPQAVKKERPLEVMVRGGLE